MHGESMLPPWPVRTACKPLDAPLTTDAQLFSALRRAVSVFHNASGRAGMCFNVTGQAEVRSRADAGTKAAGMASGGAPFLGSAQANRRRTMRSPLASARPAEALELSAEAPPALSQCRGDWGYQWCTEMVRDPRMDACPLGSVLCTLMHRLNGALPCV